AAKAPTEADAAQAPGEADAAKAPTEADAAQAPGETDGSNTPEGRPTITMEQAMAPDFIQQALVPLSSETHGGEDLGIYAIGPWAHLFQGTVEENYTFHVMDFASKISERARAKTR